MVVHVQKSYPNLVDTLTRYFLSFEKVHLLLMVAFSVIGIDIFPFSIIVLIMFKFIILICRRFFSFIR